MQFPINFRRRFQYLKRESEVYTFCKSDGQVVQVRQE